jgi:hypothetical protein
MISYQSLPVVLQKRVVALLAANADKGGKSQVARILKCSRLTIKAAAAGLPVHPWTTDRLAKAFAERDAAGKSP